jgi:hypothetical protein
MFAQYSEFAKQFDMTKLFDTKKLPTQADLLKKSQEFTTSLLELNTYNAQSVIEATNKLLGSEFTTYSIKAVETLDTVLDNAKEAINFQYRAIKNVGDKK